MSNAVPTHRDRQIADLKPGDHVCSFYEDPADQLAQVVEFVKAGLARGFRCLYITSDHTINEVRDALTAAGVNVGREQERGALRLLTGRDAYLPDGEFRPQAMIDFFRSEERQAKEEGFAGLWASGETSWALGREPGCDRLIEYESLLAQLADLRNSVILCQYNEPFLGRPCIHDVLRTHPDGVLWADVAEPDPAGGAAGGREELYRFLMENTHDIVSLHDAKGRRIYVSPSTRRLLGWIPAEPFEGIHPDDLPGAREAFRCVVAGERTVLTYRHAHADGSWRWLQSSGSLVQFRGKPHVLAVSRDVTEQKQAEDALREREEFLRLLMENTGEFVRFFDTSGKLVYANPAVERLLGAVLTDFTGFPHPEDLERSLQWFQRVLAGSKDALQWRVRMKDGEWRWMETQGSVVHYRGKLHILTICRDVTESKRSEEALRDNQQRLQSVLATLPVGVAVTDLAGDIVLVNAASRRIWGDIIVPGSERWAQSKGYWHESGKRIEPECWASLRAVRDGLTTLNELIDIEAFDGQKKTIQNSAAPIRSAEGLIQGAVYVNEDVTERVRAQDQLRRAEDELHMVIDTIPVMAWTVRPDGVVDFLNRRWLSYSGLSLKQFVADPTVPIHPEDVARVLGKWRVQSALGESYDDEMRLRRSDGEYRWFLVRTAPLRDEQGAVVKWYGVSTDIEDRKRAEEALRESTDRLRHLTHRLLEVQEEERRHLARELHDEFGQLLAAITLHLHAAQGVSGELAQPQLEECMALLRRAGEEVRSLALELRPTMLETAGLDAALRWLADQHQGQTGIAVHVEGHSDGVSGSLAIACFRVTQEALTNVVRHARARNVWIELSQTETLLEVVVRDDGVGFDVERTRGQAGARCSLGLLGMRERVEVFGGSLEVDSAPGRGTRVRASFPLTEAAAEPTKRGE